MEEEEEEEEVVEEKEEEEENRYEAARAAKAEAGLSPDVDLPPRRFAVGTKVLALTGNGPVAGGWSPGEVVGLNYREADWDPVQVAPYQIRLEEDGDLIFAPLDEDRVVRLNPSP